MVTAVKNAFDGLVSRLHTAKERISELEDMSIEITQTETQREKNVNKNRAEPLRAVGYIKQSNMCIIKFGLRRGGKQG